MKKLSLETRRKMSESAKARWAKQSELEKQSLRVKNLWKDETYAEHMIKYGGKKKGYKHKPEFGAEISKRQKGRRHTEETRKKMSESHKCIDNNWLGRKHSKKTREKMKVTNSGKTPRGWKMSDERRHAMSLSRSKMLKRLPGKFGPYKGIMFRSIWELEVAKTLDKNKVSWKYEPRFYKLDVGLHYTPDFEVEGKLLEVKGNFFKKCIMKMNLFVEQGNELFVIDHRNVHNYSKYFSYPWEVRD